MLHAKWHLHYCIAKYPQWLNITNTINTTTINRLVNTKQWNNRCSIKHLISLFHHKMAVYTSVPSHKKKLSLHFSPVTQRTVQSTFQSYLLKSILQSCYIKNTEVYTSVLSTKIYTSVLLHQEH